MLAGQPTSPCATSYKHGSPAREIRTFRSRTSLSQASWNSCNRSGRLADNFWMTLMTENWAPALRQVAMTQSFASSGKFISETSSDLWIIWPLATLGTRKKRRQHCTIVRLLILLLPRQPHETERCWGTPLPSHFRSLFSNAKQAPIPVARGLRRTPRRHQVCATACRKSGCDGRFLKLPYAASSSLAPSSGHRSGRAACISLRKWLISSAVEATSKQAPVP